MLVIVFVVCPRGAWCQNAPASQERHTFVPSHGFVPDSTTAIAIAEAVLRPIYGVEQVDKEKPFSAALQADRWVVVGHLAKGQLGGVATVELARLDARILRVTHSR